MFLWKFHDLFTFYKKKIFYLGIYRVIATNPHGTVHDKCKANVKTASKDIKSEPILEELYDSNKAPKVIKHLENVKIPETESFTLRCKFSGEPKLVIKWFKNGERVYSYGNCKLNELPDGTCELIVDSASRSDAGGYRCVAENPYGSARTTGEVTVQRNNFILKINGKEATL